MWIITFLPAWVFHAILVTGIVGLIIGFALGFIPLVQKYKLPIQIVSLLIFSLGVYLEGGLADNAEWQLRVKEMEAKVAKAEAASATVNTEIVEKVITKNQIVKQKGADVIKYIDREIVKYDIKYLPGAQCEIPIEVIKAHDAAASSKESAAEALNNAAKPPEKK
jgi:hypothetical protein